MEKLWNQLSWKHVVRLGVVLVVMLGTHGGGRPAHAAFTGDRLAPAPVSMGYHRTFALHDGVVSGWGNDSDGALGDGGPATAAHPLPKQVAGLTNVTQIAHGYAHTLALRYDGTVWSWGSNASGALGRGGSTLVPAQVPGLSDIAFVEAGYQTSFAVTRSGRLYAWGRNDTMQLGFSDTVTRAAPSLNPIVNPPIRKVVAGYQHTLALGADQRLVGWGANENAQLGIGTTAPMCSRVVIMSGVVDMGAGAKHSIALDTTGRVWGWGDDTYGQTGNNPAASGTVAFPMRTSIANARAVSSGMYHNLVLASGGEVWSFGNNSSGELGNAGTTTAYVPALVHLHDSFVSINAGYYGSAAVTRHGDLFVWGWNAHGQFGNGTTDASATAGNPGIPTKSQYFYTYDVLLLAVAKADTTDLPSMKAHAPELVDHLARLSYGKLRLKVDAAKSTYLATAADLGCTNDLQRDPDRVLNFALARAAASGFNMSRYAHIITWFNWDLSSNFGCSLTGASGGQLNVPGQAAGIAPLARPHTGWLRQMPNGVTTVHEFLHGYGGGFRAHTGQMSCGGAVASTTSGSCSFDDWAPQNMYALGGRLIGATDPITEFSENAAYKSDWWWIDSARHYRPLPGSHELTLQAGDEGPVTSGRSVVKIPVPSDRVNPKRAYYLEYRRHARIGKDADNANKPGVYVTYAENDTGYLLKLGADDPTNYNGHKPLPVGSTVDIEPKISVRVTGINATGATLQLNILP